jgi:holo-[acyl-carrier protein] synthase
VQISRIVKTYDAFGARFVKRVFTDHEAEYAVGWPATAPQTSATRLATRFAAKEATKKVLRAERIGWRDIEVRRAANGACDLALHGAARAAADAIGVHDLALSLSRDGDYAIAVVVASYTGTHER